MEKPIIIPAVLTDSFEEFIKQMQKIDEIFPYAQLDVMDGKFVESTSFQEIQKINESGISLPLELHLMVKDPVNEMRKWQSVENVFRVIFHIEADEPLRSVSFARKEGWEVGLAINPDTELSAIKEITERVDLIQFMTVYPGKQGALFQEKVLEKIKKFRGENQEITISVDGGINKDTLKKFRNLQIDIFNVGSALMMADDIKKAEEELLSQIN